MSKSNCLLKIYRICKSRGCARGFVANFWTFIIYPFKIYFTLIRSEGRRPKLLVIFSLCRTRTGYLHRNRRDELHLCTFGAIRNIETVCRLFRKLFTLSPRYVPDYKSFKGLVERFKRVPSMPVPVQKRRGCPHLSAETVEKHRVFLRAFEDNKKLIPTSEIARALQIIKINHCNGCSHQELTGPEAPGPNNQLPRRPPLASAKPRSVTAKPLVWSVTQ